MDKDKLKKEKLKYRESVKKEKKPKKIPRSKLIAEADRVFSLYIRFMRDKDKPCITCGRTYDEYDC